MRLPHEMALWKRVLTVIGCVAIAIWIVASALHSVAIECTPAGCVHRERRAGFTTDEHRFLAPTADRVTVRKWGKRDGFGDIKIQTATGELEVTWLSADEAAEHAASLVTETAAGRAYSFEAHGPRWWLFLLLLPIAVAMSMVWAPRVRTADNLAPALSDKKATRAERKRREHEQRQK